MNNKLNETFQKHLELLKNKLNETETQIELFNFGKESTVLELIDKVSEHRNQLDALLEQIHQSLINDGHSDISEMIGRKTTLVMDELFKIINTIDNKYGKK